MKPAGIGLRVPRRPDDQRVHRLVQGLKDTRDVYGRRSTDARVEADNLDPRSQQAAALRGKSVAYREAADLLDALLREPR